MSSDVAGRETFRIQRDHHLVQTRQSTLTNRDSDRLKCAIAVPRDPQLNVTDLGAHRFGIRPIPGIARPPALDRVSHVTQMAGHLGFQGALENLTDQISEHATLPGQRHTGRFGLFHKPLRGRGHQRTGRQRQFRWSRRIRHRR